MMQQNKKTKKKKQDKWYLWALFVLMLSFFLTVLFSLLTELCIEDSSILVCIIVMLVLLFLNISCDLLANAVLSCPIDSFLSMASRKIRGAKRAVAMCKNSHKMGSIFADVIGDICGIVSGSAGATLVILLLKNHADFSELVISILVSAIIGALTVGGKAACKVFALRCNTKIVFAFAKISTYIIREK